MQASRSVACDEASGSQTNSSGTAAKPGYGRTRYRDRHVNAFCKLKDFWRIATDYDKLAANFLSAVAPHRRPLAFWL